jgi:hypothetical protein
VAGGAQGVALTKRSSRVKHTYPRSHYHSKHHFLVADAHASQCSSTNLHQQAKRQRFGLRVASWLRLWD